LDLIVVLGRLLASVGIDDSTSILGILLGDITLGDISDMMATTSPTRSVFSLPEITSIFRPIIKRVLSFSPTSADEDVVKVHMSTVNINALRNQEAIIIVQLLRFSSVFYACIRSQ